MPDTHTHRCTCAEEKRPPPGSGIAFASVFGLGGGALAVLVWFLSGALVWTLLTWLFASPVFLILWLLRQSRTDAGHPSGCNDRRCLFRLWPSRLDGAVNV